MRAKHFGRKLATKNRWHQRSECGGVPQSDGHTKRHTEVAHGQAERETAEAPQNTENVGPSKTAVGRLAKNGSQIACHDQAHDPRHDNPTEETTDEPIGFPGPTLHTPVGNIETAGS